MRMNIRLIVAALVFALVFACSFVAAYRPIVISRKLLSAGLKPRGSFSMSDNGRKAGGWSLSEATPVNYQLYKPVFSTDRILPIDFDKRIERFNKPSLWSDLMPRGNKFYSDETRFYKQIAYIKPRTSFASDDFDKRSVKKGFDLAYRKPKTSFASDSPKGGLVGGYRPTFSLSEFTGAKGFTNAYRTAFSLSDSESQHYKNWWWSLSDVLPAAAKKQSGFSMSDKKRARPSLSMSDTSNRFKGGKYKPSGFSLSDERPRPSFSMSDRGVVQTQGKYRQLGWSMSDKNNRIVRPRPSFSLSDAPVVRRGENSAPVPLRCNHLVCRDPAGNAYVIRQA